jgi:hypothetical protein
LEKVMELTLVLTVLVMEWVSRIKTSSALVGTTPPTHVVPSVQLPLAVETRTAAEVVDAQLKRTASAQIVATRCIVRFIFIGKKL